MKEGGADREERDGGARHGIFAAQFRFLPCLIMVPGSLSDIYVYIYPREREREDREGNRGREGVERGCQ